MTIRSRWFEANTQCISAHQQAVALIDLGISREVEVNRLLSGTGLFYERLLGEDVLIAPRQLYRLMANAERLVRGDDVAFLFGHRLYPGNSANASTALTNATCLHDVLQTLITCQFTLTPLLAPRLIIGSEQCHLYWLDSCAAGGAKRFLLEAAMAGFSSLCRWLSGTQLPWQYHLSHPCPGYPEQYEVHLGDDVRFSAQINAMVIDKQYLHLPWPNGSATSRALAQRQCEEEQSALAYSGGLKAMLCDYLRAEIRRAPTLERCAAHFNMSSATLKRKLHKHGTHYQELLDRVRKQVSVYLLQVCGYSNEQVASYLGFHDSANFRRSFKRWTGLTPSAYREA